MSRTHLGRGETSTLLLIDDSASVRAVLRVALESEGYRVLEAADGREGVRLYREHRPALVIADIVMPEKDGIETVCEILAIDPAATSSAAGRRTPCAPSSTRWRRVERPDRRRRTLSPGRAAGLPGRPASGPNRARVEATRE